MAESSANDRREPFRPDAPKAAGDAAMVAINDHRPHNRTSITEAMSRMRPNRSGSGCADVRPIFSDLPVRERDAGARVVDLVREHLGRRVDRARSMSAETLKATTLCYLEATEQVLRSLGHQRLARLVAEVRVEIECDRPERADALLSRV